MVRTLYIYHKLSLEVHVCGLFSTVNICISNTWTPFLCYVSCHIKVSDSALTNSMHWSPSFANMIKNFHAFYGTPSFMSVSQDLAFGPNPGADEATHDTYLFKINFTTIVLPVSESHKCSLFFRVSGQSFLHISCLPCMLCVLSISSCIWAP
jgi:hypothetical protein